MKKILLFTCLTSSFLIFDSCSKVPLSGRRQLNLLPESEVATMATTEYRSFLTTNKVVPNNGNANAAMIQNVGSKIAAAVTRFMTEHGNKAALKNYKWEFNLVESNDVNAWCMPGGKVVFYTGILPLTKDENGIATVMGHEVAHAIARHGNERMSQGMLTQLGGVALSVALSEKSNETKSIFNTAYNLGAQYGAILPFSRIHELEADKMGLYFMAMAGYDPTNAVGFWERMKQAGGDKPPTFMSTHPSDDQRIAQIKANLPEAMKLYKKP